MIDRIRPWIRAVFRRGVAEREMQAEMELHLERAVDRLIARGLSPEQARLAARREFGNVGVLQEEGRDARGARWIESVAGDLRFAVRHFARKPLMAVTIVLVLSLGIGVHSAVFSLVQSVTMRPAPGVPRDDALVRIRGKEQPEPGRQWFPRGFSYPEFRDIAGQRDLFAAVAGWRVDDVSLDIGNDDYGSTRVQFITSEFFSTVGVRPIIGAGLPPNDHPEQGTPELVAVIGHALWHDVFTGSPDVVGKTVRVNDVPVRIVGVAPARFNGAVPNTGTRMLWMPLSARAPIMRSSGQALVSRDTALLQTVARLRPGVTLAQANAAVRVIAARSVAQMIPSPGGGLRDADVVALRGDTNLPPSFDAVMIVALYGSMAFLILLITCTNVSALVVGAAATRRHEIAIRLSLGASRRRLVRQLLTESMLLALAGGAVGLVLYWWITKLIATRLPASDLAPDLATAAFTMCFALGTGILFGFSPALHATRRGVADVLKDSGAGATGRSRLQRAFVVAQIALTQPLLVGVAMLLAMLLRDGTRPLADDVAERVILVRFNLFAAAGSDQAKGATIAAAMKRIAAAPGVVAIVPNASGYRIAELAVVPADRGDQPRAAQPLRVHMEATSPGYFAILDVPIVRGRDLVASDTAARVLPIVIGSDFARQLWGSADPIGKRLANNPRYGNRYKDAVIVGVFDARRPTTRGSEDRAYTPQDGGLVDGYLIRTAGPAAPFVTSVRALLREEMPHIPIGRLETLAQRAEADRTEALQVSSAAGAGGVLALLLASIGLYGVVALALGQRRREIGIRIALGARPQQVVEMLFASGLRLSVIGLVLGLPLSMFVLKLIGAQAMIPDVNMPLVGAAIASVVITVASVATWLPARRAAAVDPTVALRAD